jgi:hypothetical protein
MNKNVIWIVLCCFLTLLLVLSGINNSKNNRYERTVTDNEFLMMNIRCIPEIIQSFGEVKNTYGRQNTLFFRYGSSLNSSYLLDEILVLQQEIGKERIWIFPAYPDNRNSKIQLHNELANFNYRNIPADSLLIPIYGDEEKGYFAWTNHDGKIDMVFFPDEDKARHTHSFFREVKRRVQAIEDNHDVSVIQNGSNEKE